MPDVDAAVMNPARLRALRSLGLLDSAGGPAYDRLTRLAARLLGVPTVLISLVDAERQFFLSGQGLDEPWASRRGSSLLYSFCQHVVADGSPFIVADARRHPLVSASPAIDEMGVIAYAGVPLTTAEGAVLGALCAIDHQPRHWHPEDLDTLAELAAAVMTLVDLRQAEQAREASERRRQALSSREQRSRLEAAHVAERIARLYTLTATLSHALTPAQVAETVTRQCVAALGAYAGMLFTPDAEAGALRLTYALGHTPEALKAWQAVALDAPLSPATAFRTAEPIWLPTRADLLRLYPSLPLAPDSRTEAVASIPLCVSGQAVAVIALSFATPQPFDDNDQTLLLFLTEQCAQAVDRAQALARLQEELVERQRAEAALYAQTELYEHLLQAQSDLGEAVVVAEGERIVFVNDATTELTGYPRDELIALPSFFSLLTPDSLAAVAAREPLPERRTRFHSELAIVHRSGRRVEVELAAMSLKLHGAARWIVLIRDITARKQAEADVRLAQRALAAVSSGIVITDARQPANPIIAVNPAFTRITGFAEGEVLGHNCRFLQGTATDPAAVETMRAAIAAGRACHTTVLNYRKDGAPFWNDLIIAPVHDADGAITHFVGVQTDVTERVEAEAALWRSERLLDAVVDHIPHALVVKDARDLRFVRMNRSAELLVGLPREEMIGKRDPDLFPLEQASHFNAQDREVLAGSEVVDIPEEPFDSPGLGERWLHTKKIPIGTTGSSPDYLLVISEDITERKAAEAAQQALDRQLQETQKLESLGLLAGGIAHDFNNMLVAVLGNAELALADLEDGHPVRATVEQLVVASRRAADLTGQLLAYSGRGRFLVEPLDLNLLVSEMAGLMRTAVPRSAGIDAALAAQLPPVEADATQLRQVVMNLVINAAEALGGASGLVMVRTGLRHVDRPFLAECYLAGELQPGPYVTLEVADTGAGMDEATRARVFEPFFSTKRPGRGLGMAAVLGIVRAHHGTLHLRSAPGQGTTITVLLPPSAALESRPEAVAPAAGAAPLQQPATLLVVDDEESVRRVTVRMLARLGYTALEAASGEEGLALCAGQPALSCVLLDLTMPGLSGEQTFQRLRAWRPELPVVLISGYSEQEVRSRFGEVARVAVVQKPFSAAQLRQALEEVLAR